MEFKPETPGLNDFYFSILSLQSPHSDKNVIPSTPPLFCEVQSNGKRIIPKFAITDVTILNEEGFLMNKLEFQCLKGLNPSDTLTFLFSVGNDAIAKVDSDELQSWHVTVDFSTFLDPGSNYLCKRLLSLNKAKSESEIGGIEQRIKMAYFVQSSSLNQDQHRDMDSALKDTKLRENLRTLSELLQQFPSTHEEIITQKIKAEPNPEPKFPDIILKAFRNIQERSLLRNGKLMETAALLAEIDLLKSELSRNKPDMKKDNPDDRLAVLEQMLSGESHTIKCRLDEYLEEIKETKLQLTEKENEIENLKTCVDNLNSEMNYRIAKSKEDLHEEMERVRAENEKLNTAFDDLRNQLTGYRQREINYQQENNKIRKQNEEMTLLYFRKVSDMEQEIQNHLKAMKDEHEKQLKVLEQLNQCEGLNRDLSKKINNLNALIKTLGDENKALIDENKELRRLQITLEEWKSKCFQLEQAQELGRKKIESLNLFFEGMNRTKLDSKVEELTACLQESEVARERLQQTLLRLEIQWHKKEGVSFEEANLLSEKNKLTEDRVSQMQEKHKLLSLEMVELRRKLDETNFNKGTFGPESLPAALIKQLKGREEEIENLKKENEVLQANMKGLSMQLISMTRHSLEQAEKIHYLLNKLKIEGLNDNIIFGLKKGERGDEIDQKLSEFLKDYYSPVKFTRLGDGFYIFGSRRVYITIKNEHLVIRVGGGHLHIDEFMKTYGTNEMVAQSLKEEESPRGISVQEISLHEKARNNTAQLHQAAVKNESPRNIESITDGRYLGMDFQKPLSTARISKVGSMQNLLAKEKPSSLETPKNSPAPNEWSSRNISTAHTNVNIQNFKETLTALAAQGKSTKMAAPRGTHVTQNQSKPKKSRTISTDSKTSR